MKTTILLFSSVCLLLISFQAFSDTRPSFGSSSGERSQVNTTFPSMLDMTFPEFKNAAAKTDVALLPIGAIEEHGAHLPLGTDAVEASGQVSYVQRYLKHAGVETIIGPQLNIGITNEANDRSRDGTYMYPGSLTIGKDTFVALYVDVLRSLHDNGIRRVFLYSGHLGGRHLQGITEIVEQANRKIEGLKAYAFIESERAEQMKLQPNPNILLIQNGQNFQMLTKLLGKGAEPAFSTHADGSETSLMLFFKPHSVRRGFDLVPQSPSSRFFEAVMTGDPARNPSGAGGFPYDKASAAVGKKIVDYRTPIIAESILRALGMQKP